MANLWRTLRRGNEIARFDVNWYMNQLASYNGLQGLAYGYTPYLKSETVENNYLSYTQHAYKSNGPIFATILSRQLLFSEARFAWRRRTGKHDLFVDDGLELLEDPWPNGTTGELLTRMEQDVSLAGNFYAVNEGTRLRRLRPDWVTIVLTAPPAQAVVSDVAGYAYHPGVQTIDDATALKFYGVQEMCHWTPIPDPEAQYRGMSWLTPVIEEIQADNMATRHKLKFFTNGATPQLSVSFKETVTAQQFKEFKTAMDQSHQGTENAYKTLYLGGGADVKVIGADLKQVDFKATQGGGETRIAACGGVPPIIVGLSEGLASATYCLPGDELVWAQVGPTPIRDLRAGDLVWSHVDGDLALRRVTWQAQTGLKKIYTIRTRNRVLRASGNHPVLVRVPGNGRVANDQRAISVQWRSVEDLKRGDQVVEVMDLPDEIGGHHLPNGDQASVEAMRWLGAYTGDGCLNGDHSVRMCIPTEDRVRSDYEKLPLGLFTKKTRWQAPGRRAADGLTPQMVDLRAQGLTYRQIVTRLNIGLHPMSVRDRVNTATRDFDEQLAPVFISDCRNAFQFHSKHAVQWHHDMGITGRATTKRVPRWIFSLRRELRLAYLAGLVDTDGSIDKRGSLRIQLANRLLVEDVRMLLVGCGIQCSNLREQTFKADVLPNPGKADTYVSWVITASSADEVAQIPFLDWLYRQRVEANTGRRRRAGGDSAKAGLSDHLGFFTIRSIQMGELDEPVFDIGVDEGASFVASGIVVHNSNYSSARRKFGDHWARPQWRSACAALTSLVSPAVDAQLWYDDSEIAMLREDRTDAATIQQTKAATIRQLVDAGYEPESVVTAVQAEDMSLLVHSGMYSVQLQPPGAPAAGTPTQDVAVQSEQAATRATFEEMARAWSVAQADLHPRGPNGKFVTGGGVAKAIGDALTSGEHDALDSFHREHLRRHARGKGIELPRGASVNHIKDALWDHHYDTHDVAPPAWHKGHVAIEAAPSIVPAIITPSVATDGHVDKRIHEAFAKVAKPGNFASLADMRQHLADLPREHVDRRLVASVHAGHGILIPEENQKTLTAADREAAVLAGAGGPKHLFMSRVPQGIATSAALPVPGGDSGYRPGRDITADNDALGQAWRNASNHAHTSSDQRMSGLAELLGFGGQPEHASQDRLQQEIAAGGIEAFRGYQPRGATTAQSMMDGYRSGATPWYGHGTTANGIYASTSRGTAERFSRTPGASNKPGAVMRVVLRANARTIDASELLSLQKAHRGGARTSVDDPHYMLDDPGRFAMALGYDAITAPINTPGTTTPTGEVYVAILNRTATLVEAA